LGRAGERRRLSRAECQRGRVVAGVAQQPVDDEVLVTDTERRELGARAGGLSQRTGLRARDQHERRQRLVGERAYGGRVLLALLIEARERAQAAARTQRKRVTVGSSSHAPRGAERRDGRLL
jgi:hypothetical protein